MLGEHPQGHSLTPKGIQQDMPQGHCSRGSPQGGQRPAEITTTWTIPCRSTLDHTVVQRRHSWALCLNHGDTHERSTFAEGMLHILDGDRGQKRYYGWAHWLFERWPMHFSVDPAKAWAKRMEKHMLPEVLFRKPVLKDKNMSTCFQSPRKRWKERRQRMPSQEEHLLPINRLRAF